MDPMANRPLKTSLTPARRSWCLDSACFAQIDRIWWKRKRGGEKSTNGYHHVRFPAGQSGNIFGPVGLPLLELCQPLSRGTCWDVMLDIEILDYIFRVLRLIKFDF